MTSCQCQGIEKLFNQEAVSKELDRYRRRGPDPTTRMLIAAIQAEGVQGQTLLDIGGGLGSIQHALLQSGTSRAINVDASQAYLQAARAEAQRRGLAERIRFAHGDFVDLAPQIEPAGVVTLDRVICCYHDMERLVDLSAARAERLYGVVYPRDAWWAKIGVAGINLFMRIRGNPYRGFVHPTRQVEALIARHGLTRRSYRRTLMWQVVVYGR